MVFQKFFPFFLIGLCSCYAALRHDTNNHSNVTYDYSPRTIHACEGTTLRIECAPGLVIHILRANYGRFNMAICNDGRHTDGWNIECMSSRALGIVSAMCEGKVGICGIPATNRKFGDPCSLTPKYLEVQFRCKEESPVFPPESLISTEFRETASHDTSGSTRYDAKKSSTLEVLATDSVTTSTLATSTRRSSRFRHRSTASLPPTTTEVELFCSPTSSRKIDWPQAKPGETVTMECPNNPTVRKAFWVCEKNPVQWKDRPDLSGCVSPQITNIENMLQDSHDHFNPGIIEVIATDLGHLTEPYEEVFGGDLSHVTTAMQEAVKQVDEHIHEVQPEQANHLVHRVNQAVLKTSSNLLDKEHFDSWKDLPQAEQMQTATRMISTVEDSVNQVARTMQKPTIVVNVTVNIVVEVRVVNVNAPVEDLVFPSLSTAQFDGTDWADCDNTITLSGETVKELGVDGLAKVVFATYNNLDRWLNSDVYNAYDEIDEYESNDEPDTLPELRVIHGYPIQSDQPDDPLKNNEILKSADESEVKSFVGSKIISASVNGRKGEQVPLKEPIVYTLEHLTENNIYNPTCSFWDYSERSMDGKWSHFGCKMVDTNTTHTTCECEHLTNFAVLMSIRNPMINLSGQQKFTLSFITYFGCILSIVCLLICFVTFFCFKNLQCDRNTIHTNLVACLCLAEIVFLFGIVQYDKPVFCSVIAGVLHFLLLASFAWMCLEGIQLYVMLVEVFEVEKSRIKWYYFAAYGIPAFIVGISAIVYHEGYGTETHCWLTTEKGFIWAFVGPVCAILFVNLIMLSVAMTVMCRHASSASNNWKIKQKTKFENIRSWVKGAVVLIVLLGLTWTFGLFYINDQMIIMAYLFTVLNSFQGVFIFIFHCLMCDKVIKEYRKWVRHTKWLPERLRVKCGGTPASISTTPINSSSTGKIVKEQRLSFEHLTRLLSGRQRKRSSTTSIPTTPNQTKRGYNRIQRNSSGRESSHLTDSGIACNDDFSHIYSEPTEDPNAYLEPVRLHLDPSEDCYLTGGEISMMEGSVADTDYFDDYGRRYPTGINVDKYKIIKGYNNRVSVVSDDKSALESDLSDVDAYTLTLDGRKTKCDLEKQLLSMPLNADRIPIQNANDSLIRKKLMMLEEESPDVMIFNNLNKSSTVASKEDKRITEPNIDTPCGSSLNESEESLNQKTFNAKKLPSVHQMLDARATENSSDVTKGVCQDNGDMMKY